MNIVAVGQQAPREVGADESAGAGDQDAPAQIQWVARMT
jgi:hypothetical protein